MKFRSGDLVYASRKRATSSVLSEPTWPAKILSITTFGRYDKKMITLQYDKHKDYTSIDTISYVPEGSKGGCYTVCARQISSSEAGAAPAASADTDNNTTSSPSAASAAAASAVTGTTTPTLSSSTISSSDENTTSSSEYKTSDPTSSHSLRDTDNVPKGFGEMCITEVLERTIPNHILSRWTPIDENLRIQELFGKTSRANASLRDVRIKSLVEYVGHDEFLQVPVKTKNNVAPHMGLRELLANRKISGYSTRTRTKGLMFIFLACCHPDDVVFPPFAPTKRGRAPVFSLSEKGRLVAIIKDPANLSIVSMLMTKWSRADMDAKAGPKGVTHYWCEISKLFNDERYSPPPYNEFSEHVLSRNVKEGDNYVYSPGLLAENRDADILRSHW